MFGVCKMRIKFLENHLGRETDMQLRNLNEVVEIDSAKGLELIRLGVAQQVTRIIIPDPDPEPVEEMPVIAKVTRTRKATNG
jgi:hypothetical protein